MKAYNYFFDKVNLLIVYLVTVLAISLIGFSGFYFIVGTELGMIGALKISLILGAIMGLAFTGMVYMSRKSDEFWREFGELEKKVEKAETYEEVKSLHNEDLKKVWSKASGLPHYSELKRLKAILVTKSKYVTKA